MKTPAELFDFPLPEELIAQHPPETRGASRLLLADRKGSVQDLLFRDITELITDEYFIVINNTRVMNARLEGFKPTGGRVEVFLLNKTSSDSFTALTGGKVKEGTEVTVGEAVIRIEKFLDDGLRMIRFLTHSPEEVMERWGHVPLPPYIRRNDSEEDKIRYQTVYAKEAKSVAAPTAGLHFTEDTLNGLRNKGVEILEVSLDVGIGTFRPMKADHLEDHRMHTERYHVSSETADRINSLRKSGKKLICVGTTAMRTMESVTDGNGTVHAGSGETDIFIKPGYSFKAADALITNFHLPKSTLFVLVCAFAGRESMLNAYAHAVAERYRFFSYGDAMFIR
ncbi:tRNA preQ1(34) S-adenosylmethionine ribosyltransferase-isomerase QueA [Geovibrio thiophilus]|uniref:S-adenosylmethionine:tRNA ribosyltransferase-isomerase n=1 Tax=Geovibrio thiophilus TaxID=139438 RepID=A0A410K1Z6_9BACT|nr:tRNA preQ1(34) S-adenosylmethionine ribosyltransferase-isomerase QueA [Geovibrio thiophilus]QAR34325.1 tRNA preQ1(34) S-adenosylmethionine ribosyltransferase-isomerase QueA [Geovibrio thiophilus]